MEGVREGKSIEFVTNCEKCLTEKSQFSFDDVQKSKQKQE